MSGCSLVAIGTAVPPYVMTQQEAAKLAADVGGMDDKQRRTVAALYRKAGVETRHTFLPCDTARQIYLESLTDGGKNGDTVVTTTGPTTKKRMQWYAELASPLAAESSHNAIAAAYASPMDITHLITVSCTGFSAPGVDIELIKRLGLPPTTERVQVGFMGCHGALNGLRVAKAICESHSHANVLLTAIELCGVHYHFEWGSERLIGNALFADGSASVILQSSPVPHAQHAWNWNVISTGSFLIPDSMEAMSWDIGDLGFEMMLSARIPDIIRGDLHPWITDWLSQHNETIESIQNWVVHPGGPRVLDAVGESLQLPSDALDLSREVLRDYGNMSSPTVLFILEKVRQAQRSGPTLVLGFGPGLVAEVALLR